MEKNGKYELLYIVHPDLESSIDKITDRVKGAIESRGGKITYEENWGKRKLAYPINKSEVGIYVLYYFESPKEALTKVERDLRLTEEVMRFMLLALEDRKKPEAPKAKKEEPKIEEAEVKKAPKKEEKKAPAEDEETRLKKLDEKLEAILGDEEAAPEAPKEEKKKK